MSRFVYGEVLRACGWTLFCNMIMKLNSWQWIQQQKASVILEIILFLTVKVFDLCWHWHFCFAFRTQSPPHPKREGDPPPLPPLKAGRKERRGKNQPEQECVLHISAWFENRLFCSYRRRRGQQEEESEEDLTKDMEDPTPVPNMEEVILPKNGKSLKDHDALYKVLGLSEVSYKGVLIHIFSLRLKKNVFPCLFSQPEERQWEHSCKRRHHGRPG